jgi:flagellar biosynthesis/type III secretory pathway chaperone
MERAALARQLQSTEEELGKLKSNKAGEIQRLTKEKAELQAKLAEADQAVQKAKVRGQLRYVKGSEAAAYWSPRC